MWHKFWTIYVDKLRGSPIYPLLLFVSVDRQIDVTVYTYLHFKIKPSKLSDSPKAQKKLQKITTKLKDYQKNNFH